MNAPVNPGAFRVGIDISPAPAPIIRFEQIGKSFPGRHGQGIVTALSGIDLDVPKAAGRAKAGHQRLKATRKVTDRINASSVSIKIEYPTKVANYTDEGTRAHIIRPRRRGGALKFKTADGRTVYARSVK